MLQAATLEALARRAGFEILSISPMPGGASTRAYFRLEMRQGTAVAMHVPEGDRPEESTNGAGTSTRWPFLEVRDLLESRQVRVPKLLAEDTAHGLLIVEDLGDDTLAARIAAHPGERDGLYALAVRDLARAQTALADVGKHDVVGGRAFDHELLLWEIHHFREWGLDARGHKLGVEDQATFDEVANGVARRIAALPRGFTHRDYQSRNLMVKDGALVWIDFQDALLGPAVYDLVALLMDSYQEFDDAFVDARLADYVAAGGMDEADRARVRREFDLVTVQRKLKDAGRFVFIERVKGNSSFLPYVDPSLRKVRRALERLAPLDAEFARFRDLLHRALPEVM